MRKIEKLSQTETKTSKPKRKKPLSQIRPNLTRTSNVASTSKTQNMGVLATRRGQSGGLGRERQAAPLDAQQHEVLRAHEVRHAHRDVVSGDWKSFSYSSQSSKKRRLTRNARKEDARLTRDTRKENTRLTRDTRKEDTRLTRRLPMRVMTQRYVVCGRELVCFMI